MPDIPDIFFIRHGETPWNAEGRYQGRRDIPLNATGQAQADANGPLLRTLLGDTGNDAAQMPWHVSPLSRAQESANRVRAAFDAPLREIVTEDRLSEISFGRFEGFLHSELEGQGMEKQGERSLDFWTYRPDNGESYEDVIGRIEPFIAELTAPTIVVAHGGIARVFRYLVGGTNKVNAVNWAVPQNVVMHFSNGKMQLHESDLPSKSF